MKPLSKKNTPGAAVSLLPFAILIAAQVCVIRVFGTDALGGPSQAALILAAGMAIAICMLFYGTSWQHFENAILDNIRSIGGAVLILLMIGAVAGSWMVSGVVPLLMYYGLKILTPSIFLFATCIICALVSLVTGSSWSTIATIGVAFIGVGAALGYSAGWTAGAIISGAYFGDKISPLSDTTVLASSVNDTPLFTHIRYMMITTVPSITITCIIFLIVSLTHGATAEVHTEEFSEALCNGFNLSPWLLIVPVITGFLIAKRAPALATLFLSALAAGVAALLAQPEIVSSIGDGDSFRGLVTVFCSSTSVDTGFSDLNSLVETGGMSGMLDTIFLVLCAATFGGALTGSGMMASLTQALTRRISSRTAMVSATVGTGVFSNIVTCDQYLSIILTSSLYKGLYREKGYEGRLLSRSAEDSATVTSVLIPWNSCGMTQSTVLKVPTLEYLPFCFFNIISPLMSVLIAATGYRIFRKI